MLSARQLCQREWWLLLSQPSRALLPLSLFVAIIALFPLALGSNPEVLHQIASGVLWVGALLAVLMSFTQLFQQEFDDGTLEQWLLQDNVASLMMIRLGLHWLFIIMPLLLLVPLFSLWFYLTGTEIIALIIGLLLGTPTLCCLGALFAALLLGLPQANMLISLLLLPLTAPILIFGSSMVALVSVVSILGQTLMLAALALIALCLTPFALSSALRLSVSTG